MSRPTDRLVMSAKPPPVKELSKNETLSSFLVEVGRKIDPGCQDLKLCDPSCWLNPKWRTGVGSLRGQQYFLEVLDLRQ